MAKRKTAVTPRTALFLAVSLLLFILYLYFFVDTAEMVAVIQHADFSYYLLAAVTSVANVTLYSQAWQFFLRVTSVRSAFRKTLLFVWTGIFVDFIIPFEAISSDIVKTYLMSKETNEDAGKIAASVVGIRIFSMAVTIGGLIIGSVFLIVSYELPLSVLIFVSVVSTSSLISLVLICYVVFREQRTWAIISRIINFFQRLFKGRWQLSDLRFRVQKFLGAFHQAIEVFVGSPKRLVRPLLSLITAWFCDVSTMLLVFYAIGFEISFSEVVVVYSLMLAIQAIPIGVPAEVGLVEIIMTSLYTTFGVPSGASAAATVLTRALTFWSRIIIGYFAAQWVGIRTLKEIPSTL